MQKVTFRGVINVPLGIEVAGGLIVTPAPVRIYRSYDPFDSETALFLEFTQVKFNMGPERIVTFASMFGLISDDLNFWHNSIIDMWHHVSRWKAGQVELFDIDNTTLSIRCTGDGPDYGTEVISADLWTCLRLQFNLAVINELQFPECEVCGRQFAVSAKRKNRRYCGSACSSKAYRERKAKGEVNVATKKQSSAPRKKRRRATKK